MASKNSAVNLLPSKIHQRDRISSEKAWERTKAWNAIVGTLMGKRSVGKQSTL